MATTLLYVFISFVFIPTVVFANSSGEIKDRITKVVNEYRSRQLLSGVLAVKEKENVFEWNSGLANDTTGEANDSNTVFLIASLSKGYVSAAILKLAEENRLLLTDALNVWMPEYPRENLISGGQVVTLETLLTHTSGVPESYMMPEIEDKLDRQPLSFQDMLGAIKNLPLKFIPGTRYEYSNTGYLLLGEVVRRSCEKAYHTFLQTEFFNPLQLKSTTVGPPSKRTKTVARPYENEGSKRSDILTKYGLNPPAASDVFADTNIYTTIGDLRSWATAVTSGKVLTPVSTRAMLTPHLEEYGYGWLIYTDSAHRRAYEHAGDYAGYQSWARIYPDNGASIFWLSNQAMPTEILFQFINDVSAEIF